MSPIASDLSYLVLQRRRRLAETGTPALDDTLQALYPLQSPSLYYRQFIADPDMGQAKLRARDERKLWPSMLHGVHRG